MPITKMQMTFSEWYDIFLKDMKKFSGEVDEDMYGRGAVRERLRVKGFEFLPEKEVDNEFGPVIP
jgi:hypothetical protein